MKKSLYVLISLFVVVLLIIVTAYLLREPKDSVPSATGVEGPK